MINANVATSEKPAEQNESKEAKPLVTKTIDALSTKEISGEVEIRGQKVIFPLSETLTPSARFVDLEKKFTDAREKDEVGKIDTTGIDENPTAIEKDAAAVIQETSRELLELNQFFQLVKTNPGRFKIINENGDLRLADSQLRSMPVKKFLGDQGLPIDGVDLFLLSNVTDKSKYTTLFNYGFDVDFMQAGTTGSGELTGVKLTYELPDGKEKAIVVAFTKTGQPETANDTAKIEEPAKVLEPDKVKEVQFPDQKPASDNDGKEEAIKKAA